MMLSRRQKQSFPLCIQKSSLKCLISFFVVTLQMSSLRRPWPRRDYKYVEASVNGSPRPWSLHNQGITKFLYFVLLSTLYYTWWLHNTVFAPILPRTDFAPGRRPDKWRGGAKLAMSIFDKTQKSQCVFLSAYKKLFCKHKQQQYRFSNVFITQNANRNHLMFLK